MGKKFYKKTELYKNQHYSKLCKQHQESNTLFNDVLFPASKSSIGSFENLPENIEWKRPKDLCESPYLILTNEDAGHVVGGPYSCDWIVAACSILGGVRELCYRVIPDYNLQEFSHDAPSDTGEKDSYCGIFHFQFWRFGCWVDVVIDDLLPTSDSALIFTQSSAKNEFWVALVEKAYAKLHGSYEGLMGGHLSDALVDFTGGVSEIIDMIAEEYSDSEDKRSSLFEMLTNELHEHSIINAVIPVRNPSEQGRRTEMGLLHGQHYTVTGVKKLHIGETKIRKLFQGREKCPMVRLYDPGNYPVQSAASSATSKKSDSASNYAYSTSKLTRLLSKHPEWSQIRDAEIERMGLTLETDKDLWMPLEDFVANFTELIIIRLLNSNIFMMGKKWHESAMCGEWTTGAQGTSTDRAGGCPEFADTFLRNPQFLFDISDTDTEIVVQLLQWDAEQPNAGMQRLLIGFSIIKVEGNRKYRLHRQWPHCPTLVSVDPTRKRELYYRGRLVQGRYLLLPYAHKPGDTGRFLVRTFSGRKLHLREATHDVPRHNRCLSCVSHQPLWVTVVHIRGAEYLDKRGDPYCVVECEGKKARTAVTKHTNTPVWNSAFVFYRKNVDKPITITVYNHSLLCCDSFLGQIRVPATLNHEPSQLRAELLGKGKLSEEAVGGCLLLDLLTDDSLTAV